MRSNQCRMLAVSAVVAVALGTLTACSSQSTPDEPIGGDVIAPLTMDFAELNGGSFELQVGQVLSINTGDAPVDGFTGEVSDGAVVIFVAGYSDGPADFNPGLEALDPGTAEVTVTSPVEEDAPATFDITVVD